MPPNRKMRGEIVNTDSPNVGPLEALLGRDLASGFTWMFEIELRNRTRIHAYLHGHTLDALLVTRDGRCYHEETEGSYRQIAQYQAINAVYRFWTDSRDRHSPVNALTARQRAVLAFTRDNASFELLEPGEETALLAGPQPGPLFRPRWDSLDGPDDDDWPSVPEAPGVAAGEDRDAESWPPARFPWAVPPEGAEAADSDGGEGIPF